MSAFSDLMAELAKQVPMTLAISGEEYRRVATLTPNGDGKERILCWRGEDPDPSEFPTIVRELIAHLRLDRDRYC